MRYSRYWVILVLLSVALPLMTGSLNSTQKQSPGSDGAPEATPVPTAEGGGNSKDISRPKADIGLVAPSLETILARISQAAIKNQTHLRPYTVTREYRLFGKKRSKSRSQVIADVTFQPPNSKNYRIAGAEGSGIGERIVRLVLQREVALAKDGSSDISRDNYNFRFLRQEVADGRRCYLLQLLPIRPKDKNLLRGTIWVDAHTYLICRTEGEPEKNPSWWVRKLHIVFVYADVGGMWLPTSSEFTARVRLLGLSIMRAHDLRYSYPQFAASGNGLIERPLVSQRISLSFSSSIKEVR